MPPKARTSNKRARSPAATKAASAVGEKTQTGSSKRTKKDAQDASAAATAGEVTAQEDVAEPEASEPTAATETNEATATAPAAPAAPSFHGNFDLYAMSLPFLNSVFAPARDYAALLATLRTYQAKPDNSARIFLPAPSDESPDGRFRSGAIEDPLEDLPFDIALESIVPVDAVTFGAREGAGAKDAFYADSDAVLDKRGVSASVALEESHCGVSSTTGAFQMRRAWVSEDGKDEVFEGFFKIDIVYSGLYRRKCGENRLNVSFPFWAIRARIGEDGKEVGLGRLRE